MHLGIIKITYNRTATHLGKFTLIIPKSNKTLQDTDPGSGHVTKEQKTQTRRLGRQGRVYSILNGGPGWSTPYQKVVYFKFILLSIL